MSDITEVEIMPHDLEAENYVLGACLLSDAAITHANTIIKPDDFHEPKHRILFQGITELLKENNPVDAITVTRWLREHGQLERVGGASYLNELILNSISTGNTQHHCKLVLEHSSRRRLLGMANSLIDGLHRGDVPISEAKEIFQREMEMVSSDHGEGLLEPMAFRDELNLLQDEGLPRGMSTGWRPMDQYYRVPPGLWTAVTGIPGMGKTSVVNHLAVNLMENFDWRFLIFSAENLPYSKYISRLLSLYLGKPFFVGPSQKLSKEELGYGLAFFQEHLRFVDASRNISMDEILSKAETLHRRWPLNGIVVDPWNELAQDGSGRKTETEQIGEQLTRFRRFCRTHNVHGWIVAHPAKMQRNKETGQYDIPTAYDISGSAHWRNKADFVLSVHRDTTDNDAPTKVLIQKVRFQEHGQLGCVELSFNKATGQYASL